MNEFSWSYSRWKTFNKCKRAYFYRYCVPDAWDKYAAPETGKIYLLKNLIPLNIWVKNIIAESLRETLTLDAPREMMGFLKLMRDKIARRFRMGIAELLNRDWENDPKRLNISEFYYSKMQFSEIEQIPEKIKVFVSSLFNEGLCEKLLKVDYLDWKTFSVPLSFDISGIKCWAAPELIWRSRGKIKVLFMNYGHPSRNNDFWMVPAGLTVLYAEKFYHTSPDNIECIAFFSDASSAEAFSGFESPVLVHELILKSSSQMRSFSSQNADDYPCDRVSVSECAECVFREICPGCQTI